MSWHYFRLFASPPSLCSWTTSWKLGTMWSFLVLQLGQTSYYKPLRNLLCLSLDPRACHEGKGTGYVWKTPPEFVRNLRGLLATSPLPQTSCWLFSLWTDLRVGEANSHQLWALIGAFLFIDQVSQFGSPSFLEGGVGIFQGNPIVNTKNWDKFCWYGSKSSRN